MRGGQDAENDVITQPDGKILAIFSGSYSSFYFGLGRLNYDGTRDSSFAVDGIFHYHSPKLFFCYNHRKRLSRFALMY